MTTGSNSPPPRRVARSVGVSLATVAFIIVTMMWMMGVFHHKISDKAAAGPQRPVGDAVLAAVEKIRVPVAESATGTVRPVHEAAVASKILAKVVAVNVKAGDRVTKDMVLVRLDDADLKARQQQAEAAVNAATAVRDQAKVEFDRADKLLKQNAASQTEFDRVATALKTAEAELDQARQALEEAKTAVGNATILSGMNGVVVDKQADVGDMVIPGQVLLKLYDPTRMQMVASVRESLTHRLKVGQSIEVTVAALGHPCQGQISEIVPEAQSASRTFLVKVTGPCPPGVYAGMFGRLSIPLDEEEVLVIPQTAIRRVGQLALVDVADGPALRRRAIQTGRALNGKIEVLSGLREGEQVALSGLAGGAVSATGPNA